MLLSESSSVRVSQAEKKTSANRFNPLSRKTMKFYKGSRGGARSSSTDTASLAGQKANQGFFFFFALYLKSGISYRYERCPKLIPAGQTKALLLFFENEISF